MLAAALRELVQCDVVVAASGVEARQLCAELKPDLAVIDFDLPGGQLYVLIKDLRELVPQLPVVLTTYYPELIASEFPVQGVLAKPPASTELATLVERLLNPPPRVLKLNEDNRRLLVGYVEALSHMLENEPVLLTQGNQLFTIAPHLSQTAAAALTEKVVLAGLADGAGSEGIRFEGDAENSHYRLHTWKVVDDWVLGVVLRVQIPLILVRNLSRDTAAEVAIVIKACSR